MKPWWTSTGTTNRHALGISFEDITAAIKAVWDGFCELLAPVFEGAFQAIATINVYGHEGQDISALADEIEERININMTRRKAAFI